MTIEVAPSELDRLHALAREAGYRPASKLREGMLVGDQYELVRLLGEGGMGSVWAATHVHSGQRVALKFLKGLGPVTPQSRRRLLREARAATMIQHPNILAVNDIVDIGGAPMLIMDLLEGESLGDYLSRQRRLPLAETAHVVLEVVSAISAAHAAGIVHRDLKPDNIFLVALPGGERDVKVLDFGLAKLTAKAGEAATSGGLTRSGDIVGTPQYMAPEQAFGERDIDHRVDIWALGVILHECLTGSRPFAGDNLGQVLKRFMSGQLAPAIESAEVPNDLATLVGLMLSLDRAERPDDLSEVHRILGRYAHTGTRFTPNRGHRQITARRVAAAMALLVVVGGGVMAMQQHRTRQREEAHEGAREPAPPLAAMRPPELADTASSLTAEPSYAPRSSPALSLPDRELPHSRTHVRKKRAAPTVTNEDEARVPLFAE